MRRLYTKNLKSLVLKVGTSVLTRHGRFDKRMVQNFAAEVSRVMDKGVRVSIVSSGAIGSGMIILDQKQRPKTMEGLQAAAAIGQRYLMQCYEEAFSKYGYTTAQVLLTWDDLASSKRFLNAKRALGQIQRLGAVPIINENDTVATEEIKFGDNDKLSALLAILIEADLLVVLSDTEGLFEGVGSTLCRRIKIVERTDEALFRHVRDSTKHFTVGGMRSKLSAIRMAVASGIPVFLAGGRTTDVLTRLLQGEDLGTLFLPHVNKYQRKSKWLYYFKSHVRKSR